MSKQVFLTAKKRELQKKYKDALDWLNNLITTGDQDFVAKCMKVLEKWRKLYSQKIDDAHHFLKEDDLALTIPNFKVIMENNIDKLIAHTNIQKQSLDKVIDDYDRTGNIENFITAIRRLLHLNTNDDIDRLKKKSVTESDDNIIRKQDILSAHTGEYWILKPSVSNNLPQIDQYNPSLFSDKLLKMEYQLCSPERDTKVFKPFFEKLEDERKKRGIEVTKPNRKNKIFFIEKNPIVLSPDNTLTVTAQATNETTDAYKNIKTNFIINNTTLSVSNYNKEIKVGNFYKISGKVLSKYKEYGQDVYNLSKKGLSIIPSESNI